MAVIQKIHSSRNIDIKILTQAMKGLDATSMFAILKPFFFPFMFNYILKLIERVHMLCLRFRLQEKPSFFTMIKKYEE